MGFWRNNAIVAIGTLTGLLATPALAADLPVKAAPALPMAAPWSWTGFYLGGTAGAAWSHADVSLDTVNTPVGPLYFPADIPGLNAIGSPDVHRTSAILGLRAGYNVQWGAVVAGIEGDMSWLRTSTTTVTGGNPFIGFIGGRTAFVTQTGMNWLATIRPRLGYAFDRVLVYGTGGLAFARVKFDNSYDGFSPLGSGDEFEASSASKTKLGWVAGLGLEYALTNNWLVNVEYLHVDLGSITASGLVTTGDGLTATMNFSTRFTSDIARAGVAYKF